MSDLPEHISIWGELADTDHELRHVDVHGVRTRVLRAGSGPDLVLLHGTGGHLEAYARDIAGLAADFRVTAYDMVGHGWSDLPDPPYTIDAITHPLVLQDPEIRKDFAWDPGWVGKIGAQTLLLWTDHDPTGGLDEAAMLLDWLPDARLYVIEDAGHWPQWEKREEYLRVHHDFLLRGAAGGAALRGEAPGAR